MSPIVMSFGKRRSQRSLSIDNSSLNDASTSIHLIVKDHRGSGWTFLFVHSFQHKEDEQFSVIFIASLSLSLLRPVRSVEESKIRSERFVEE